MSIAKMIARVAAGGAALLLLAVAAIAQEAVEVERIEFVGNRRYSETTLEYAMRTKEGRPLDRDLLAQDEAMLRQFFEEITVQEEMTPRGVVLRFVVTENPLVSQVLLLGIHDIPSTDLEPLIETRTGYPLARFRLENDVRIIERFYRRQGYHFVEVTTEIIEEEGSRRVIFRIVEGPEVTVDDVEFEGAVSIPHGDLVDVMQLEPSGFLSPTPYVERMLEEDRIAVAQHYRDEGWLDARAWVRDVRFSDDREDAIIVLAVEEGEPWSVGEVQVTGGASIPDRDIVVAQADRLLPGQRYRYKDIDTVVRRMEEEAQRQGFTEVRIDVEPVLHPTALRQDVRFVIVEGNRFTLRRLDVSGNVLTRDKVILREFTVAPGDPLDMNAIRKSVTRVFETRYFTDVQPVMRETDEADEMDVEIRVEENPRTSNFRIGFGVSSDTGVFGSFDLTLNNFDIADVPSSLSDVADGRAFKGAGQTLNLTLQPGSNVSNYRLAFTEPWIGDRPILFGFDLFASENRLFRYDQDRAGASITVQRRWLFARPDLDDVVTLGVSPRVERVRLSNIDRDAPPNAFDQEGGNTAQGVGIDASWSRQDRTNFTERGFRLSAGSELIGKGLGGDFDFLKHQVQAANIWTLWRDDDDRAHTLTVKGGAGFAQPLDDGAVPLTERFFAGGGSGIGAIRGFEYGGVGPHGEGDRSKSPAKVARSIRLNEGDPMGGEALAAGTVEYGFPVFSDLLRGAVFVDAGNLAENTGGLRKNWRASWGFGIAIKIPVLGQAPLRFDFGFPIAKERGDDRRVLSFNFTQFF